MSIKLCDGSAVSTISRDSLHKPGMFQKWDNPRLRPKVLRWLWSRISAKFKRKSLTNRGKRMPALSGVNVNRGVACHSGKQLSRSSSDLGHIEFCTWNDGVTFKENDTDCFCVLSDITKGKKKEK